MVGLVVLGIFSCFSDFCFEIRSGSVGLLLRIFYGQQRFLDLPWYKYSNLVQFYHRVILSNENRKVSHDSNSVLGVQFGGMSLRKEYICSGGPLRIVFTRSEIVHFFLGTLEVVFAVRRLVLKGG